VELHDWDITLVSLKTLLSTKIPLQTSCIAAADQSGGTGGQQVLTINTQGEPVFFKDLDSDGILDGKNIT